MRGGLRRLLHPATPANKIDIEGTREHRRRLSQAIRERQQLLATLEAELAPRLFDSEDRVE